MRQPNLQSAERINKALASDISGTRSACNCLIVLAGVGLLIGCDKNTSVTGAGEGSQGTTTTPLICPHPRPDVLGPASLKNLVHTIRKAVTENQIEAARERFRLDLVKAAERAGSTPIALAARLILANESEEDQEVVFHFVLGVYRDLSSQIALSNELPAGRMRSGLVNGWASTLEQLDRDQRGLQTLYDSIPVGASRTYVGTAGARLTMSMNGLPAALDYIAALEMPEERVAAYRAVVTKVNLEPFADNKEIQAKSRAIIESFPKQFRELYSASRKH